MTITVEEARLLYGGDDAAHDFGHVLRVLALAEGVSKAEGADLHIVRTAALLHDVAHGQPQHHLRGAEQARALLRDQPADVVEAVVHCIAAHRFRSPPDPQTLEAQVVYDADKLDAIGAVGVARAFAHGARRGQPLFVTSEEVDPESPPAASGYTTVHEFVYKLARLHELLYTETARTIARGRHEFMIDFFRQLDAELHGDA